MKIFRIGIEKNPFYIQEANKRNSTKTHNDDSLETVKPKSIRQEFLWLIN